MISFNKPHLTGKETHYIYDAVYAQGHISGNGTYTKKCQEFFQTRFGFTKCLLTTSCTDALEMAALLIGIKPGDEVIVPSYTFVSTALAFIRQGATVKFCDSRRDHPGIDEDKIEGLITNKTKAIVPVHYAGVACDMNKLRALADKYHLFLIEDAAQAIDSRYGNEYLGGIGHLGCFSFHETKNISCGEGGMLVINDKRFADRADILWEKGTNRKAFFRGDVDKYGWVDIGSSFLPSDINAAFLYAQLEELDDIQSKRKAVFEWYHLELLELEKKGHISLPVIPDYASQNGHMFYIIVRNIEIRTRLIQYLREHHIMAVFHYQSLHKSEFYKNQFNQTLTMADTFNDCLVRLPFYYALQYEEAKHISTLIKKFFSKNGQ